jgi:rhodanese-related sulfurtransferase
MQRTRRRGVPPGLPLEHAGRARSRLCRGAALLLAGLGIALAAGCGGGDAGDDGATVDPADLAAQIEAGDAPFVLDVRSPEEFAAGHVPGAVNIPHTELPARLDELEPRRGEEIVVMCERGGRAHKAETMLTNAGFENVRDLAGHMSGWRERNLPVE